MTSLGDDALDRRQFLKIGATAVAAGAVSAPDAARAQTSAPAGFFAAQPIPLVRIGMVGIGLQGGGHVENFLKTPGCRITAVCDIREARTTWASQAIVAAGHPAPSVYTRGPRAFERLCDTEDLDLVFTATPWEWHVPVMLAAMKAGKHAATEVPAAMTLDDCWALVEAAERHQRHAVMMENCNYDRAEMMAFNLVRQGAIGEVLHAEGGYLHDLRQIKFERKDESLWRRAWSMKLDGNPYPTHRLGLISNCLDTNRDRVDYLVSMSGPAGAVGTGGSCDPLRRRCTPKPLRRPCESRQRHALRPRGLRHAICPSGHGGPAVGRLHAARPRRGCAALGRARPPADVLGRGRAPARPRGRAALCRGGEPANQCPSSRAWRW